MSELRIYDFTKTFDRYSDEYNLKKDVDAALPFWCRSTLLPDRLAMIYEVLVDETYKGFAYLDLDQKWYPVGAMNKELEVCTEPLNVTHWLNVNYEVLKK